MSRTIGVLGSSGTGKSTAMRNLDPSKTLIINIAGKEIPFKGSNQMYKTKDRVGEDERHNRVDTYNPKTIEKVIESGSKHFKNIVVDDIQYLMAIEFMNRIKETGWDKFQDVAKHFFDVIMKARTMEGDTNIFFMGHISEKDDGKMGLKTVGKATDQYTNPEGLFTMILQTQVFPEEEEMKERFKFMTQTDGQRVCRTPMGMFDSLYIPNDLQLVVEKMEEYYS